jgi:hypothetical protein
MMLERPPRPPDRRARKKRAQARWRANVRTCACYPLILDAADLQWLVVEVRYLAEGDVADKRAVAEAVRRMIKDAQRL